MKVLVTDNQDRSAMQPAIDAAPWRVLLVLSVAFMLVGFVDSALTFIPTAFGTTEWEFGTVTASLNGLPLPLLSLGLFAAACVTLGWPRTARSAGLLMVVLALLILAMGLLYLTTLPQALNAARQAGPMGLLGIKRAIIKTSVQLVVYPVAMMVTARTVWKLTRRSA